MYQHRTNLVLVLVGLGGCFIQQENRASAFQIRESERVADLRVAYEKSRLPLSKADYPSAIEAYSRFLTKYPNEPIALQWRGEAHFMNGEMGKALDDFDKNIELAPQNGPQNWQRGLTLYYLDKFAEGQKQFESHQTVNSQDVENAAWHFLCVARQDGVEKARAKLIPIRGDTRVPMKQVHRLFAGTGTVEQVLQAAGLPVAPSSTVGSEDPLKKSKSDSLETRRAYYANLYIGLYYEALGESDKSRQFIGAAAKLDALPKDQLMSQVANVHQILRKKKK